MPEVAAAVAGAYGSEWGRIASTLIRVTGDWSLAEDAAQDAFETALARWGRDGIPSNPGAWLTTVAKNRALDRIRRSATEATKIKGLAIMNALDELSTDEIEDDRLRLIFTCCHPALGIEARVALTLRTVAGLTTTEIARAFLVPEPTMAQRLVRARAKIKNAGIPYRVPVAEALPERLAGVLAVLYLLFNEGYSPSAGEQLVRESLAEEAIRVTRLLVRLMPDEPEALGLLALMLLQHSRRDARSDAAREMLSLEEQDRELWHRDEIAEGVSLLERALRRERPMTYQLQAVIAACHATADSTAATDFRQILVAYQELARSHPSPVVDLNRAIAWGMLHGPQAGLEQVNAVAPRLDGYYLVPAAQADFLRRLGRNAEAVERYRRALELAPTAPERRFLSRRLAELGT